MHQSLRMMLLTLLIGFAATLQAQTDYFTLTGTVVDSDTGQPMPAVNIAVTGQNTSIVTNADGHFILKTYQIPHELRFSHVGYRTIRLKIGNQLEGLRIKMHQADIRLRDIVVKPDDPFSILHAAIAKITVNYSQKPELFRTFYRETTRRGKRYIYVAEAVADMYKTDYEFSADHDRVSIDKARRLISTRATDTLGAKMQGGPTIGLYLDAAKNFDFLFDEDILSAHNIAMADPQTIDDRPQYVIRLTPKSNQLLALYSGYIYIDRQTLAFSRIEIDLDVSFTERAAYLMLVSKPAGVRFKPLGQHLVATYSFENGVSRLSYVSSITQFKCDWKRRLFSSPYTVTAEMVVTDRYPQVHKISGKSSFRPHESLYDKVALFDDPQFWGKDNIIEPDESLENAIDKLKRRLRKQGK